MVGSVDPDAAKYRATSREQASRQELIEDFEDMAKVHPFGCNRGAESSSFTGADTSVHGCKETGGHRE